jgi:ribosome maturation factor RimP
MNTRNEQLHTLIEPSATALGFRIVQINMQEGNRSKTLQILAERISDRGMSVDECAKLSRQISAVLDVEDVIPGKYTLEVSSPGIDRPLIEARDFEEYLGFEAKIETILPMNGRKRFKGDLTGFAKDVVTITVDGAPMDIALADIQSAKLVLTDALIKAHQERYKNVS